MFESLQKIKDKSISATAKMALGIYLKPYGEVQMLNRDELAEERINCLLAVNMLLQGIISLPRQLLRPPCPEIY